MRRILTKTRKLLEKNSLALPIGDSVYLILNLKMLSPN